MSLSEEFASHFVRVLYPDPDNTLLGLPKSANYFSVPFGT